MMEEADRLCQRIAIIDRGSIVAEGSPRALKAEVGGDVIHVTFESGNGNAEGVLVGAAEELVNGQGIMRAVKETASTLTIRVRDAGGAVPSLMTLFHKNQLPVANLSLSSPTLDDVFLQYTGRQIRAEETSGDEVAQSARQWLGLSSGR
jgi:ABC-2 type transport system ATP-binding protein